MFWLWSLLSLTTGAMSCYTIITGEILAAVALHIFSAAAAFFASSREDFNNTETSIFDKAVAFCIPGIGGIFLCLYLSLSGLKSSKGILEDFEHYVNPKERLGEDSLDNIRKGFRPDPDNLSSMADVLRSNASVDEKRIAIEGLSKLESPEAIKTLREVLSSNSVEVRFYAASCLSALEERLAGRLKRLEEDVSSGSNVGPETYSEISRTLLDYAYYGIVDGIRKDNYLKRAYKYIQLAIEKGAMSQAYITAGRILLMLDDFIGAEKMFNRHLRENEKDIKTILWRAEAFYMQGKYRHMSEDCKTVLKSGKLPERLKNSVSMWV